MVILDTNLVSELMRSQPHPGVVAWVDQHRVDDVYLTTVTAAELCYGVARLPAGRRRVDLAEQVRQVIEVDFQGRVLPFDLGAAGHYAQVAAARAGLGQPISMADAQIAAICRLYQAPLATRNGKDFADTGIEVVDPFPER